MKQSKKFYYHLEVGAPETEAIFVFLLGRIDRIELASVAFEYVIFRVVYPERSYLFGFRRGYPYNYPDRRQRKIRLSPETYRVLHRLADLLIAAVFCGVQPRYEHKKGRLRIDTGELFKLCSALPSTSVVEVEKARYTFRYSRGEYYFRGETGALSQGMLRFLFRFLPQVMRSYKPYQRKLGELLDPLALFTDLEKVPVRKVRQMRHRRNIERLIEMGKPPKLGRPRELEREVVPNLFEPRTLPE